jgi:hypothetical protein
MNRKDLFYCLKFKDDTIFHKDINSKVLVENLAAIFNRDCDELFSLKAPSPNSKLRHC